MKVDLKVNGKDHSVDVEADMPLLWALRDVLKMTGTKFGCGQSLCGACTVHVNGAAIRSCITPASAVAGQEITTIEGLNETKSADLQKIWVELGVPQCGFCQPGQLMQAASLLTQNSKPSSQEIETVMTGNLCRCGTYMRIRDAIVKAAEAREA